MRSEPPPTYVAFVERHLESLRRDAARVVGDERDADQLYPEVLADVAARWQWLDLLHTRLRRPEAGERYLRQALHRRSQRWQGEQLWPVEIEVRGFNDPWAPDPGGLQVRPLKTAPPWSSVALRLAPHLTSGPRVEVKPLTEAAIAWWHAYEARRRHKLIAVLVVLFLLVAVITRLQETTY
jgi:hypothetical protein